MVKEIRIYFEGDSALTPGFDAFLREIKEKARSRRCEFKLVATNGTPVQDFHDAIKTHPEASNFLLMDSEDAITEPLPDLCTRKGLARLSDSVFWMAQVMESWFLADTESLKQYYGDGFRRDVLQGNPSVEKIPKRDVLSKLKDATRGTRKSAYHKTAHAPHLLAKIDPESVKAAAPNCKRLFDALLEKLEGE